MAGFTVDFPDTNYPNPYGVGPHHFDTPPYTYKVGTGGKLKLYENGHLEHTYASGLWTPPVVDDP